MNWDESEMERKPEVEEIRGAPYVILSAKPVVPAQCVSILVRSPNNLAHHLHRCNKRLKPSTIKLWMRGSFICQVTRVSSVISNIEADQAIKPRELRQ